MRSPFILPIVTMFLVTACGRAESNGFILRSDDVAHVEGCHIKMFNTNVEADPPFVALKYVCGLPESALVEKNWTGNYPPPLGFSMNVGDCLLLDKTFYCVESIKLGEVPFKATYKWATTHHDHLERIR
jgi:hypothetical protein